MLKVGDMVKVCGVPCRLYVHWTPLNYDRQTVIYDPNEQLVVEEFNEHIVVFSDVMSRKVWDFRSTIELDMINGWLDYDP